MNELYEVAVKVLALCLPAIGIVLITSLFKLARAWTKLIEDERIRALVERIVQGAEQKFGPGSGEVKLEAVRGALKQITKQEVGDVMIEAAVFKLNREEEIK